MNLCGDYATALDLSVCPHEVYASSVAELNIGSLAAGYGFAADTPMSARFTNIATGHQTTIAVTRTGALIAIENFSWVPFPGYVYLLEVVGRAAYGQIVPQRFHPYQYGTSTYGYALTIADYDGVFVRFVKVLDGNDDLTDYTIQYVTLP